MQEFMPQGLGHTIFKDRYARSPEETWLEACRRVANHVAQAEENGRVRRYSDRFYEQLVSNRINPGGRIWYGSGRPKAQLLNCFVVPTADSREGWGKTTSDVIIISGLMGGVGINVSPIRPRGYAIKGTGGVATGAVSLMELINGVGNVIVGGGGRRMALMLCLDINHPDLEEFLSAKLEEDRLNNANISIVIPPELSSERLQEMIRNEEDIELSFNGIPSGKTINAGALWARLVENAWANGEPGVLNGHLANKMNNLHYYKSLISTNPCGEIWLEPYGCCDLGALVLPRFVEDGRFDWDGLDESVRLGVRFLDNVLSVNHYPLPEIKDNCENVRRLGLGVMGLHTMLLEMRMTYDSRDAFSFVDRLFRTIKNTAYDASINLAIEKGPFPAYDARFLDSGFAKSLKRGIRNKIKEHGIRNCAMLTIAPTGTTSMVSGVSSGIEPIPAPVYWRNFYKPTDDGSRVLDKELVVEDAFYKYDPNILQSALDIPVKSHFEMQKIVQDHIDNAVSKTINMPADADMKAFGEMWLEYLPYCKGTTVYRYGSRENEPINPVPREQWDDVVKENQPVDEMTVEEFMFTDCVGGVCEVPQLWQDQSVPVVIAKT
jgi:ribonucleoside-diphosphate reductase alpha chain